MKEAEILVRYRKKYKVTTNRKHTTPLFENKLLRYVHLLALLIYVYISQTPEEHGTLLNPVAKS